MKYPDQLSSYFPSASVLSSATVATFKSRFIVGQYTAFLLWKLFKLPSVQVQKCVPESQLHAVQENALFVVDPRCLKSVEDLKAGKASRAGMVASEDVKAPPHLVTRCPMWKARKVCSRIIAGADHMGCLQEFLSWFQRAKPAMSLTALAIHGAKQPGAKPSRKG